MISQDREAAWQDFIAGFFSRPNELQVGIGNQALDLMVSEAREAWMAQPPSPIFLPARVAGGTYCYAICPDSEQRLWVRDLVCAYLGSWIAFDGEPVPGDSSQLMDRIAGSLTASGGCSYRFQVPQDDRAQSDVRQGLSRLTQSLAARPHRRIQLARPLGRLIGDFWDACASGAETRAGELLELLAQDHRLSRTNGLFLRLQFLAVFERWDQLEELEQLPDLLRLDRPVLASDALARLAMARLPDDSPQSEFDQLRSRFGALVPAASAIRSSAGAQYYALWSLSAGDSPSDVRARLADSGWLEHALRRRGLAVLGAPVGPSGPQGAFALDPDVLGEAIAEGRLDGAVDLMASAEPSERYLPLLIDLVVRTLSPQSLKLLEQWRALLGETSVGDALKDHRGLHEDAAEEPIRSLNAAVTLAFDRTLPAAERTRALEQARILAVPGLMRPGGLRSVMDAVRQLDQSSDSLIVGDLVDLLLDMERDLHAASGAAPGIQDFRLLAVEVWALGDDSGNRHRASRILDLVERLLDAGVSHEAFDEVVELLRAAWKPFLTDADAAFSLEAIEILAARSPDAAESLPAFAVPILTRIGQHNAHRISRSVIDAGTALGAEFGLQLVTEVVTRDLGQPKDSAGVQPPAGTFIAIYTLMESASRRASLIIRGRYPEVRVEALTGRVSSNSLKSAAKNADILVIADRAAAHSATDALTHARGRKPIEYARGKGTASLLEATEAGLERMALGNADGPVPEVAGP